MRQKLTLQQAAKFLNLPTEELCHLVQRDGIPHYKRGEEIIFVNHEIEAWASRRILGLHDRHLQDWHGDTTRTILRGGAEDKVFQELCKEEYCSVDFAPKTAKGALRDITALAGKTGLLYDELDLFRQLEEREATHSTGMPGGVALLHPAHHDPYLISDSFIYFARTKNPIHFGAPDDQPTSLFFLICCRQDSLHLHALARLCQLLKDAELIARVMAAETAVEARQLLVDAEEKLLKQLAK